MIPLMSRPGRLADVSTADSSPAGTSAWAAAATGLRIAVESALRGRPPARELPSFRMLFVAGCPRSGTTWIQAILAEHPLVLTAPESHAYARTAAVRRFGPHNPRGWAALFRKLGPHPSVGLQWYADRATLRRLAVDAARGAGSGDEAADRFIAGVFDGFVTRAGGTAEHVLVEKTPNHLLHARRIFERFPRARMVEVVRDGRDVCTSMQMRAPHVTWIPVERERQVATWVRYVEEGERLRADPALTGRMLRLRFEDVKADPTSAVTSLFAFAGLPADPAEVERIVAATDFSHHRGPQDGSSPNRRGEVGDWEAHFSDDDIETFRRLAGETSARAGYRV